MSFYDALFATTYPDFTAPEEVSTTFDLSAFESPSRPLSPEEIARLQASPSAAVEASDRSGPASAPLVPAQPPLSGTDVAPLSVPEPTESPVVSQPTIPVVEPPTLSVEAPSAPLVERSAPPSAAPAKLDPPVSSPVPVTAVVVPPSMPAVAAPPVVPASTAELDDRSLTEDEQQLIRRLDRQLRTWAATDWIPDPTRFDPADPNAGREASPAERREYLRRIVPAHTSATLSATMLVDAIMERHYGLFGLERYLNDENVSDISINRWDSIWVEGARGWEKVHLFSDKEDLADFVERLKTHHLGPSVLLTRTAPRFDGQFLWPSTSQGVISVRVNLLMDVLSSKDDFSLSLRKPTAGQYDQITSWMIDRDSGLENDDASLDRQTAEFIYRCFEKRANILVVGGTGTGKTTLMKALIRAIPNSENNIERVVVIEDSHELVLDGILDNYVGLHSYLREPSEPGYTDIAGLIQTAMRMRPDRIIVGECRKPGEVMGFLEAINTGHDGSITTTHASSALDGLARLLTLAAQEGTNKNSLEQIASLIRGGLDLIISLGNGSAIGANGRRKRWRQVLEVATIDSYTINNGEIHWGLLYPFARLPRLDMAIHAPSLGYPLISRGETHTSAVFRQRMELRGIEPATMTHLLRPSKAWLDHHRQNRTAGTLLTADDGYGESN